MTTNQTTTLLNVLTMIHLNPTSQDLSIYYKEDYTCDRCNGTGEKVKRGNHTSISMVRKCYACNRGMVTAIKLLWQRDYITRTDSGAYECTDKGLLYLKSVKCVYGMFDAHAQTYVDMGYEIIDHINAAGLHETEAHNVISKENIHKHHMAMYKSHMNVIEGHNKQ